jgi:CopG antitoxin of type II toxin-antitoxin system
LNDRPKAIDPIPEEFGSYEEAAEFWDTHDTSDYPENFVTVETTARQHVLHGSGHLSALLGDGKTDDERK